MFGRALSFTFFREQSKVIKLFMNDGVNPVGFVRFSEPCKNNNVAYLHSIEIAKDYRKQGLGTYLLNRCEYYLKNKRSIPPKICGVLWDNQNDLFVQDFFTKNDYKINHREVCLYDDGESVFDILPIEKNLKSMDIIYR